MESSEAHAYPKSWGCVMREFHYDSARMEIIHPTCARCGAPMWLTRIEPDESNYDRRTFECKACGKTVVEVVKYR
jgi:transposase-like protein